MIYLELFIAFLKVGCFSFGGAYGAIPLIKETALSYHWVSEEMLSYFIAVGESTPGSIMVNLATYIGNHQGGILGAVVATFAVVLPAFLIILLVVSLLKNIFHNVYVNAFIEGIKPCVIGIIIATGLCMVVENVVFDFQLDINALIMTILLLISIYYYKYQTKKELSPIYMIILSAILGICIYSI